MRRASPPAPRPPSPSPVPTKCGADTSTEYTGVHAMFACLRCKRQTNPPQNTKKKPKDTSSICECNALAASECTSVCVCSHHKYKYFVCRFGAQRVVAVDLRLCRGVCAHHPIHLVNRVLGFGGFINTDFINYTIVCACVCYTFHELAVAGFGCRRRQPRRHVAPRVPLSPQTQSRSSTQQQRVRKPLVQTYSHYLNNNRNSTHTHA